MKLFTSLTLIYACAAIAHCSNVDSYAGIYNFIEKPFDYEDQLGSVNSNVIQFQARGNDINLDSAPEDQLAYETTNGIQLQVERNDIDKDDVQRHEASNPEANYQFAYETSNNIQVQNAGNSVSNNLEIRNLNYKATNPGDQFTYETSNDKVQVQQVTTKGSDHKSNFAYDDNELKAVENSFDKIHSLANEATYPQDTSNGKKVAAAASNIHKEAEIHMLAHEPSDAEGNYQFAYETTNGIQVQAAGNSVGVSGAVNYISPGGKVIALTYTADEEGYHPVGDHLPTPPPMPDYIRRSLEYIRSHPPAQRKRQHSKV